MRVPIQRQTLQAFWTKIVNDWILNLAGLLAYNILMASFPLLFVALALVGFSLGAIDPAAEKALLQNIAATLPAGTGNILITATTENLRRSAGYLLILGVGSSVFLSSRLFITLEDCFGIIFRRRPRSLVRQNVMAVGLLLISVVLIPIFFLLSLVPKTALQLLPGFLPGASSFLAAIVQFGGGLVVTFAICALVLAVVPNQRPAWRTTWPGAALATVLITLMLRIFPWYASVFLRPQNFGSVAVFAIVIIIFFYYLALMLLLGAELNSWLMGLRATKGDLPTMLYHWQTAEAEKMDPGDEQPPGDRSAVH